MKWFMTRYQRVEEVEIERETFSSVFINGRRSPKFGSYENYFSTWEGARAHLLDEATRAVESARRQLEIKNGALGNIKGMKQP